MRQPWPRAASSASSAVTPATIGSRSALPIDPRSAFQLNGLADTPAATMPVAPAASATRTIAPTLPGSCTSTATTINGTTTNFTLKTTSGGVAVPGTVTYDAGTKVATFTPSSSLATNTVYTATVTTGVKDAAGNAMAANKVWAFTTVP